MAIEIIKQPVGNILNAYNNSIFEFKSSSSIIQQQHGYTIDFLSRINTTKAIVTVNDKFKIEIQPIRNSYYINLKESIKMLINQNNFADEVEIPGTNTFIIPDLSLYLEANIKFEVIKKNANYETATVTKKYLKSVQQLVQNQINHQVQEKIKLLLPYTNQTAYAAFWEEAPFDIAIYSSQTRNIRIRNKRTLVQTTVSLTKGVSRIYISNGMNDFGFESEIPLMTNHINELEFIVDGQIYLTLNLEKLPFQCGTYLKWFNTAGGWSYWKFNPVEISSLNSKTNTLINRDFENLEDSNGNYSVVSKSIDEKRELKTGMLNFHQRKLVETILRSPKVYLFNANPYQDYTLKNWKEIKISDSSQKINNKPNSQELKISIDLPDQYIQNYAS